MSDTVSGPITAERGEMALELAGARMGLRPSYEAIAAAEASSGRGLIDLARDAFDGGMSMATASLIAVELVRAWGRSVEDKGAAGANATRIGKLMLEAEGGFNGALKTLGICLTLAATGGYDAEGNLKPAKTTTTEAPKAPVAG